MRRFALILGLLVATTAVPGLASAQSLIGSSKECGTYEFDGDLVKGRTDGMVVRVDHTEGCYRYKFWTIIGTSMTESYGYPGQQAMCERAGREAAVGHFKWYRGIDISPASVRVSCTPWTGGD
jgi:hypothetical protein